MAESLTTIHVYLLDEGTDVWRPVEAVHLRDDLYQIPADSTIPETETWEFQPGQIVRCKKRRLTRGDALVAVESVHES